jgi:hypothetical protein
MVWMQGVQDIKNDSSFGRSGRRWGGKSGSAILMEKKNKQSVEGTEGKYDITIIASVACRRSFRSL